MKTRHLLMAALSMLVGWGMAGVAQAAPPTVSFEAGDRPGNFFACTNTGPSVDVDTPPPGCVNITAGQKSLAVIRPGDSVGFPSVSSEASTIHTALSLLYPTAATNMPYKAAIDFRNPAPGGVATVTLTEPGLYVFICDIHVYMFAAVIVDDPNTPEGLDLSKNITLVAGPGPTLDPLPFPTYSDLAIRLLRTFFIVTDPGNWKDYTKNTWSPVFPAVPVIVCCDENGSDINVPDLSAVLSIGTVDLKAHENRIFKPKKEAVGEIWVDTQFELTAGKSKPGTATAIDGKNWNLTKKVALPAINMNHPHNMWTDKNQEVIYQTQWFSERVAVFDRTTGALIRELNAGPAPSHVMTRANNDQVHVAQNGGNNVREFDSLANGNNWLRDIPMSDPSVMPPPDNSNIADATHPHGHWMSADGMKMVTPNENIHKSTVFKFSDSGPGEVTKIFNTGAVPIATGMMPDSSKYYVANLLGHSISVFDMNTNEPTVNSPINLIEKYNPVTGVISGPVGALPIQTPVSPDGTNMITANTLTATITIVDTKTDKVVAMLPCDPGCHGVNYGAKKGGGYYAYVASKFSNALIVVDPDPNGDGNPSDAAIVGRLLLADKAVHVQDDKVIGNPGMGGQGVLPVPLAYNGWVQKWVEECTTKDCKTWNSQLTPEQKNPYPAP